MTLIMGSLTHENRPGKRWNPEDGDLVVESTMRIFSFAGMEYT